MRICSGNESVSFLSQAKAEEEQAKYDKEYREYQEKLDKEKKKFQEEHPDERPGKDDDDPSAWVSVKASLGIKHSIVC